MADGLWRMAGRQLGRTASSLDPFLLSDLGASQHHVPRRQRVVWGASWLCEGEVAWEDVDRSAPTGVKETTGVMAMTGAMAG